MTWQTILYFSSILLTGALTGFLAGYAWRQPPLPGVRAYAGLALCECLMALTDVISMLSGTQAQALFWFQMRFLFTATIPLIFLAFALAYSGQTGWLSKKLLAGALVIPAITQIMLWSNSLHGLWVKQEVAFHQNGPLWIVETSARIPGLWFLVHSFYTQILMLAGMVLIFLTAWRMRRQYREQALLLAAGALVGLTGSLLPTFNLIPQAEFNPFIPGIGLSAVFYAFAIFRFQFLKRTPAQESALQMASLAPQEKRSLAILSFIFILFASGLAAVSYLTYQNYEKQFRAQVESQLSAIADLKVSGLENWRAERMGDAETFYNNPAFAALVQKSFENPDNTQARVQLQAWLDTIHNSYRYNRVFLLDLAGVERISSPAVPEPVASHLTQEAAAIIHSGQVTFLDFHRDTPEGSIHLALLVPIFAEQDSSHPLGLLVLRIDPETYLYPYLQQWPVPSQSAETLLVRREGDNALFLNPLRFQPDAALNLRIPLKETETLAVKAALGQEGVVDGEDYRDVAVVGDLRSIPNSPWFLVARMDTAEVYAPLRERQWQAILFFGALLVAAGAGLLLVWRQQRVNYYRAQVETAESLRKSEEQYRGLIEHASDGIFITDAGGKYVEVNPSGCAMLGYTRAELLSKQISDLVTPEDVAATPLRLDELQQGKKLLTERRLIRKDGSLLPVEISARMLPDGRFQSIIRDITDRKRAADTLREINEQLAMTLEAGNAGVWEWNLNSDQVHFDARFHELLGYIPGDLPTTADEWKTYHHPEDLLAMLSRAEAYIKGESPVYESEHRIRTKAGDWNWVFTRGKFAAGNPERFIGIAMNVTERKQAEETLRESERRLREAQEMAHLGFWSWDIKTGAVEWSDEVFRIFCLDPKEFTPQIDLILALSPWAEDHQRDTELINQAIETHIPGSYEQKFLRPDQSIGYYYSTFQGNYAENGDLISMVGTVLDITKRKRAENAMRESEERFRRAVLGAPFPIMIHAEDGEVVTINTPWIELTGYNHSDIPTIADWTQKAYGARKDLVRADIDILYDLDGPKAEGEYTIMTSSGRTRIWDFSSAPIGKLPDGRRLVISMAMDVTARKQAEAALMKSEKKYRLLHESMIDGFVSVDMNGMFQECNEIYRNMLGYSEVELSQLSYPDITPEKWHSYETEIVTNQILKQGYSDIYEKEYRRKDGTVFPVELHTVMMRGEQGEPVGMWAIARDVTERKQAEEKIRSMNVELEQRVEERTRELRAAQEQLVRQERLATLGQLAGSMSHELRNPLGVISNAIYYLKMAQPDVDEKLKEYLDIIEAETHNADKIISDLLDFSRIKSVDVELVAVHDLIRRTLERFPAPENVQVTLNLPEKLPAVYVDPRQMTQVLGNLVLNACQAMPNGGKLTLSAKKKGKLVAISVADTGVGITPENIKKLFEPLFTTKPKGIGLGLAISKKLAEANGGRIEVESEAGLGSSFTLILPVKQ